MITTSAILWILLSLFLGAGGTYISTNVFRFSELFAEKRAYYEVKDGFIAKVLRCGYCTSFWAAVPFTVPISVLAAVHYPLALMWWVPYWLCTVLGATVIHDILKHIDRTPRLNIEHGLAQLDQLAHDTQSSSVPTPEPGFFSEPQHPSGGAASRPACDLPGVAPMRPLDSHSH